VIALRDSQKK
jgi:hypothetical protein